MLRLALYFENRLGRNDGNPLYVLASLKRMEERGELTVDHLVPNSDYKKFGSYDAHIVVDWGEDGLTGLLPYSVDYEFDGLKVYWASDTHLGYDYRLKMARWAEIVFVAQKDAVAKMKADGVENPIWLPHAVEPYAYCDIDSAVRQGKQWRFLSEAKPYSLISKPYDVCFIGHVSSQNRVDALDRLFREFPNFFYGQRLFNEAARKYAESKIVFNIAMKNDLNMRVFEALGSRSFLLTDNVQSIGDLFENEKHLVLYNTLDEAVEKARYYLAHDEERDAIARSGYSEVIAHHTIDHRVRKILSEINKRILQEA